MFVSIPSLYPRYPRRNGMAYLFWRWAARDSGAFQSKLDAWFFGPSRGFNDYEHLAASYQQSDIKPDKQYSILPTVLYMVGDCTNKNILDIGCGSGFFTLPLAQAGASRVWGIDNSEAQLQLAKQYSSHPAICYVQADCFTVKTDSVMDVIVAPFVANYARSLPILRYFFGLLYEGLRERGKIVLAVDLPNGKSLRRFGASKRVCGKHEDEAWIEISLFNGERSICTLNAKYYTPETLEAVLREVGFQHIRWHDPIVSDEGMRALGADFWEGYTADPELGYITAER